MNAFQLAACLLIACAGYYIGKERGRKETWDDLGELEETLTDLLASVKRKPADKEDV